MGRSNVVAFDDFGGGQKGGAPEKLTINESQTLQRFTHIDGSLVSMGGRILLDSTALVNNGGTNYGIDMLFASDDATTPYLFANCGSRLWMYDAAWYPLMNWTGQSPGFPGKGVQFGTKVYFNSNYNGIFRYDGFHYITGTATCAGATTAVTGGSTVALI